MQTFENIIKNLFEIAKQIRNIIVEILIESTILLLKIDINNIAITIENKIETIFLTYFSFLLTILIDNLKKFLYLLLIEENKIILKCKTIKAIYKTSSNKILEINNIISLVLQQLICRISK